MAEFDVTPEQRQEYEYVFKLFDTDGSGSVSLKELGCAMRSLGMNPSEKELEDMLADVDEDGSGVIEFNEFLRLMNRQYNEPHLLKQLEDVFHKFDNDQDGYLNANDLVFALKEFTGTSMTDEEALEVMSDVDPNGDGKIDMAEFIKLMCEPTL